MNIEVYSIHHIRKAAQEFNIPYRLALWTRKRSLECYLKRNEAEYDGIDCAVGLHFNLEERKAISRSISAITREIAKTDNEADITDEMIERARAYPMDKLIEFDRTGKALCFNHDEKTPSLSYHRKTNRAKCFGQCNKSWDTIGVLMARDGVTFVEAIKRLS